MIILLEVNIILFKVFLDSIALNLKPYINNINLDTLNLTKAYLFTKDNEFKNNNSNKVVEFKNIHIDNDIKNNKRASKEVYELLEEKDKLIIQEGLDIHKYFEETDFLNISKTSKYYDNIKYLIDNLNIDKDSLIYKEHEFIFEDDNIEYHGIIDLIIENKDIINIVDYKLKNIDDPKYLEQLKVYYNYIKLVSNKKIKLYLYSIINNELKEVVI